MTITLQTKYKAGEYFTQIDVCLSAVINMSGMGLEFSYSNH